MAGNERAEQRDAEQAARLPGSRERMEWP